MTFFISYLLTAHLSLLQLLSLTVNNEQFEIMPPSPFLYVSGLFTHSSLPYSVIKYPIRSLWDAINVLHFLASFWSTHHAQTSNSNTHKVRPRQSIQTILGEKTITHALMHVQTKIAVHASYCTPSSQAGVLISRSWTLRDGLILSSIIGSCQLLSILYLRFAYHKVYEGKIIIFIHIVIAASYYTAAVAQAI